MVPSARIRLLVAATAVVALVWLAAIHPSAQARVTGWSFPGVDQQFFSLPADFDGDGDEELVMPSIDGTAVNGISPPTPVYVLGVVNDAVVNRTADFFDTAPLTWMTRTLLSGDFNGDGQLDLYLCTAGRETADRSILTTPRTPGIWGEQDRVFFNDHGHLVERTETLPESVDYSHGCSSGDIYKTGRSAIVINDVAGPYIGYRTSSAMLDWNGTRFETKYPFPVFTGTRAGKPFGFYTIAGDFDNNGYADVIGDSDVLWGGPSGPASRALPTNALETATFGTMQGRAVADFNGDGYPDAVKIVSTRNGIGANSLIGARFILYTGGKDGITEKLDAFPSIDSYSDIDFGIDVAVLDLNFDGFLDMATQGKTYVPGNDSRKNSSPNAVWLNDGTGRFTLAHFSDRIFASSVCNGRGFLDGYFLKTADPQRYNFIAGGCYPGAAKNVFTARTVTPSSPLVFTR